MTNLDDVLARLQYDRGQWEARIDAPCWPEPVEIWLPAEQQEIGPYQRRVLERILKHPKELKSQLEAPLFEWTREFTGETFEALDADCNLVPFTFPALTAPSQIWTLLSDPVIQIEEREDNEDVEFEVVFSCKWDVQHCLYVTYVNFEIADIH